MKVGGILMLGLFALAGCSRNAGDEHAQSETAEAAAAPNDDLMEYGEEQIAKDDPRARIRDALDQIGHASDVPEDATEEELEAILDEKVDKGLIPREHAEKLMKVLETANARNERLELLDQQLFGENTH
ncbi:MAG: hypothetical protein AAF436_16790 [Myxococcota bacterium]